MNSDARYYQKHRDSLLAKNRDRWSKNSKRYNLTAKKRRETFKQQLKENPFPLHLEKECTVCHQHLTLDKFSKNYNGKYGRCHCCKECRNKRRRERWANDKQHRESINKRNNKAYHKNIDKYRKEHREYASRHKSDAILRSRKFYHAHKNDPRYVIGWRLKNLLNHAVQHKNISTMDAVGCDIDEFLAHLELQFTDGMAWSNYGKRGWHIDHIVPINCFDLLDPDEVKKCYHFTNLQPLWWYDNIPKGDKPFYYTKTNNQGKLSI